MDTVAAVVTKEVNRPLDTISTTDTVEGDVELALLAAVVKLQEQVASLQDTSEALKELQEEIIAKLDEFNLPVGEGFTTFES